MSFLTKLVLLPALLAVTRAEFPLEPRLDLELRMDQEFDLEYEPEVTRNGNSMSFRLPEDLDMVHVDMEITPYFENAPSGSEPFTFDGVATLKLKVLKEGLTALILQDNVRDIKSVTLTTEDGTPVLINEANPFERIREFFFLRVNLRQGVTLVNGANYLLKIEYVGNMNETPLTRGMFRGRYRDGNGNLQWYAATHLQPTHGRQLVPCLDEPGFKSTFDIIVNRPAHYTETFSNMRIKESIPMGDRVKEIFYRTPRMSAYLITIHISDQFTVLADNNDSQRSYRIIGRPNAQGQGNYALEVGPPITKWFEDYLGIGYYSMADGMKNDQLASPDWASGATENWGLVTYRELRLLYQEGETNAPDKMNIATITAHELAHKWFGNYITARWWDNVWINEGFASYFEYFGVHGVYPEMELEDQFAIMYVQSALSSDSSASTRALRHTVNSPAEVTGHFSGISYSKGASLLLMLKHLVTENTFKKALNLFLTNRAYQFANPEDVYKGFVDATAQDGTLPAGVDISNFMKHWVDEPGSPVLNVNVNMQTGLISLSQERFFISPTASQTNQLWHIPLTYTTGNNPNWNNLKASKVMQGKTDEIQGEAGHHWVIFNLQQKGLYRVNYDTHNWEMIASALKSNPNVIHHLNRAQIVDDLFALMRSKKVSYALGFQVLDFLKQDTSYYSWYPAISGLNWIRNRFLHLPEVLAQYDEHLFEFLDAVIKDLGYNVQQGEKLTRTLNRFYTLSFACNIGHKGCVDDAVEKFRAFRSAASPVNPNIRRHVFCEGLRAGDYDDWKAIYDRRLQSNNQADEVAMLRALGCTSNTRAIQEYLEMLLSDNVKAQDRVNGFTFLYMGSRGNAKAALPFLKARLDDIRKAVILPASFNSVLSNTAAYLDEEGLQDMEQWLRANQASIPEANVGLNGIASARASMDWGTNHADEILSAVRGGATVAMPTITLLVATLVAMMIR